MKKLIIPIIATLLLSNQGVGQESDASAEDLTLPEVIFNDFSIGGMGGMSVFHGDLANYYFFPRKDDWASSIRFGYKAYMEKDIIAGAGARLMFSKGKIAGGAQKGAQSHHMNFKGEYWDVSIQAKYRLSDLIFKKASDSKFFIHGYVGIGMLGFRSVERYTESGYVRNYVGYEGTPAAANVYWTDLQSKTKAYKTLFIPVSLKGGYRITKRADLIFEWSLNNSRTDLMDTWVRDWTAKDKYTLWGLGLQFTFNRSDAEELERREKKQKEKKDKVAKNNGKRNKGGDSSSSESLEMLNTSLKILELQLKMFEMQYLENNNK